MIWNEIQLRESLKCNFRDKEVIYYRKFILGAWCYGQDQLTTASEDVFRGVLYDLHPAITLKARLFHCCDQKQFSVMTDENGYFMLPAIPKGCFTHEDQYDRIWR